MAQLKKLTAYFTQYRHSKVSLFQKISEEANVSMMTAERWCRGYYCPTKESHLVAIANIIGCSVNDLRNEC